MFKLNLKKKLYGWGGWCTVLLRIWSGGPNVQLSNLKIQKILCVSADHSVALREKKGTKTIPRHTKHLQCQGRVKCSVSLFDSDLESDH